MTRFQSMEDDDEFLFRLPDAIEEIRDFVAQYGGHADVTVGELIEALEISRTAALRLRIERSGLAALQRHAGKLL